MHKYKFTVRWGDTDAAGIVFTPNFYKWMDEATHEFTAELIKPSSKLFKEDQLALPILEAFCQFSKPLMFEDEVVLETNVINIQNKTIKFKHDFLKDDEVIATGYMVRAWTSFKDQPKALPIPAVIIEKLSTHLVKEEVLK
ncbi:MAG TPA: thioesterase family protein [Ureibacillus sp.]|nr:thioesterase family protein [Ureibacillus sp.]